MDNRLIFLYHSWHVMRRRDGFGQVIHILDGGLSVQGGGQANPAVNSKALRRGAYAPQSH